MPSLYDISIPVMTRALRNLDHQLAKAAAWATERGVAESTLTEARLIADMRPLTAQVQSASDSAKGTVSRVGGLPPVAMADDEITIADLRTRIGKTIAVLEGAPAAAFAGKEEAEVILSLPGNEMKFTGASYVLTFALPNFYFHVTTAYALLRMQGVPVGKMDFLFPQGV